MRDSTVCDDYLQNISLNVSRRVVGFLLFSILVGARFNVFNDYYSFIAVREYIQFYRPLMGKL